MLLLTQVSYFFHHLRQDECSAEKDLGKDCSKLGGPEEDNSSQYYESCSNQSQANLENQIFAELYWRATLAVYWASLMAALPMETAILTIRSNDHVRRTEGKIL